MVQRSNGIRKSDFAALTTISSSATFDFVYSGTNYKILASDLVTSLGVTGSITQVGLGTDTPILDDQGTVKGIRNVSNGVGITSSVDANNGIEISTNFIYDTTGEKLVDNIALARPTFKSLVAGSGMGVSSTDDAITFTAGGGQNEVIVNSLSDFPSAVANVITLAASTTYKIFGTVAIGANRLVLSLNTAIVGGFAHNDVITSTNAGAMLTATSSFKLDTVGFETTGEWISATGSASEECYLSNLDVESCTKLGTFTTWHHVEIHYCHFEAATTHGFLFVGACEDFFINGCSFDLSVLSKQIDLGTATFEHISIGPNNAFHLASGITAITVAASSANLQSGETGHIFNNFVSLNSGTATSGLSSIDGGWSSLNNEHILNTHIGGQGGCTANATGTSATTTPAVVALGTSFVADTAFTGNFTVSTNGRFTYNGQEEHLFSVNCSLHAAATSGSAQQYNFQIAKNGTVIASSLTRVDLTTSTPQTLGLHSLVEMVATDYVEVYVTKATGSDTLTVDTISISVYGT